MQLIAVLAEAPASAEAPLMATYNSVGKTLSFSKGDLIGNWGSMVGNIITLQFGSGGARFGYDPPRDRFAPIIDRRRIEDSPAIVDRPRFGGSAQFRTYAFGWPAPPFVQPAGYWPGFPDFGDKLICAKVASVSVEGDEVKVGLTTDGIKTKGRYAEKEVKESLAKVDSGDYTIDFYPPHTFYPSSDNGNNQMFPYVLPVDIGHIVLPVDIGHIDGLANGKTQIQFTPNVARLLTYDAATEMVGSVSSDKYLEKSSKEKLKSKMKLYVKTTSGANVFAIESLEKRAIVGVGAWSARVSGELKAGDIKGAWIDI